MKTTLKMKLVLRILVPALTWMHPLCHSALGADVAAKSPYAIRLFSRQFTPDPAAPQFRQAAQTGRPWHGLIQFEQPLSQSQLDALGAKGIKVRHYISAHTVSVTVPADIETSSIAGVRWSGELTAHDKLIGTPARDVIVEFFRDTPEPEMARIIKGCGGELQPTPSLPKFIARVLLPAEDAGVRLLASNEMVSSVATTPEAVLNGRSVHYCPGPMTIAGPVASYVLRGDGWDGPGLGSGSLTYYFGTSTSDLGVSSQRAEIVRAFNVWSRYAAITWNETSTPGRSRSFDIHFAHGDHGDGSPFDGSSGVLAHCFYPSPPNPEPIAGDMHFDDAEVWRIGANYDLFTVALHEAGHGLGLNHSNDPNAVMAPYYAGVVSGLAADDIAGIRAIYASAGGTPTPEPTSNDYFAYATSLQNLSGAVSGNNTSATKESGEPAHAGNAGGKSLWYRWTAPASGNYVVNTHGSSFDTVLAIYTGSSMSSLSLVGANDDSSDLTSEVQIAATAGLTYRIAVDGYNGGSGSVALRWDRLASPIITSQPASRNVALGQPTTFTVSASGAGTLAYQWYRDGIAVSRATGSSYFLAAVRLTDEGSYSVRVSNQNGSVMSSSATLNVFVPDLTLPKVKLVTPPSRSKVYSRSVLISGLASDNRQVARVEFSLNGSAWQPAQGTTTWSTQIAVAAGPNCIQVRAVDGSGNYSPAVQRSFTYIVTSQLSLQVIGGGTVAPNLNGRLLEVGRRYTIKARPSSGYLFSHWSGGAIGAGSTLSFVMTENLSLTANFVANPFPELAGAYNGLFYDTNGVDQASSGYFSCKVTGKGAFTATVRWLGLRVPISGQFRSDGKATNIVSRSGYPTLDVELELDMQNKDRLTGRIRSGSWNASLVADRAGTNRGSLARLAANYALVLPATDPRGNTVSIGEANVLVDEQGNVTIVGRMADGSPVIHRTTVSSEGYFPFHASLNGGQDSAIGWIRINPDAEQALQGLISWICKSDTSHNNVEVKTSSHIQACVAGVRNAVASPKLEVEE